MMNSVCVNGQFYPANESVLFIQNRSFKFGDGVFETMRVNKGTIPLAALHKERLRTSLQLLRMQVADNDVWDRWMNESLQLATKNRCEQAGRVRLTVYREGTAIGYSIEAIQLDDSYLRWKQKGETIDIFPHARKSMDAFTNIKSTSYLTYIMAGLHAAENGFDDCLVLNNEENICDSSKANVFVIKEGILFTPSLDQGCIQGVMRKKLIEEISHQGLSVREQALTEKSLLEADEIFLTNALYGIRPVHSFKGKIYQNQTSQSLYHSIITTIFP